MKLKSTITILAIGATLSGCTAHHLEGMVLPEGRLNRTRLTPYLDDNGAKMFRYEMSVYPKQDQEQQRTDAQTWLAEWLTESNYCRHGYDIIKNHYTPWPLGAPFEPVDMRDIGGTLIAIGKCKVN